MPAGLFFEFVATFFSKYVLRSAFLTVFQSAWQRYKIPLSLILLEQRSIISILLHFPLDSSLHFVALMLHVSSFVYIYLSSGIWFGDSIYCWPAPNNFLGSFLMRDGNWIFLLSSVTGTDGESDWAIFIECLLMWSYCFDTLGK